MPVSVDDPFLLASFSSTTHNQQQHQAVSCTPEGRHSGSEKEDEEDSSILVVAVQGTGVQLFNTVDQKCVLSYSTPPGYSFTGSAQTLYKSAHLRNVYAVIAKGTDVTAKEESKIVWMWKDESASSSLVSVADADSAMHEDVVKPSSAKKTVHKFDRRIHQLFVSPLLPSHVVLTNSDGSISLVTEDLKRVVNTTELQISHSLKPSKKEKKGAVTQDQTTAMIWSTTYSTSGSWIPSSALARNTLIIMTVVVSDAGKTIATLSYVHEEQRGFSTFGQVEIEAAAGSSGFAFDVKSGQLSFMTATGQLKIYNFEVNQGDHIITATETLTLPLPGYAAANPTTSTKPTKKGSKTVSEINSKVQRVDTIALGDNYLAVAGIHQIDGKAEQTLTIWDTRYGTLQAKHVVPGSFSAANTTCQLALLPESVLVMTISTLHNTIIKSDIFLCHFYAEPMSLLGAMGRMKDTAPFLGQKGSTLAQDAYTLTTTALLTPSDISGVVKAKDLTANSADLKKQLEEAQVAEKEALESLVSQSKTSTAQEFESVFFQHVERQTAEAVSDLMERYGVDAEEAKAAVAAKQEKDAELQKQKQQRRADATQDMDVDVEPVNAEKTETKKDKKAKKAAKVAESEKKTSKDSKVEKKESKSEKKAAKKAKAGNNAEPAKDVEDGSSSESSSDDDDDEADEEEVVVLSSDDEREEEKEEEPEYEVDEEQERAQMEAYLNSVDEWRKAEAEAIKSYRQQQRLLRAGRKQPPLPELSHHFLTTVVGRCFTRLPNGQPDMSFWPAKVIEYLIENQLVGNSNPGAGQAGVALELMEREQWPLLELALKKLYDIPELDMITLLKQVIGLNKNKGLVASKDTSSTAETGSSTSLSPVPDVPHFLNLIMAAPRNEIFMQQAIKKLSIEDLSIILEILKGWIGIWDERGGVGHQNQQPDKKQLPGGLPGYGLMIDFTTLIMDVHFPSLILSPQLHPVLKAIQSSIQREREISDQLEQALRGPLGLFDRKYREMMRRKKEATVSGYTASGNAGIVSAAGGVVADKRRRRKWEGGEGIPDYAVEIIHL